MRKKITVGNFENEPFNELKKFYKVTDRQLEQELRKQTRDAKLPELQKIYDTTVTRK